MELYDKDGNRLYLYELYGYEIQTICASTSLLDHKLIEEIKLSMQRNEEEYRETELGVWDKFNNNEITEIERNEQLDRLLPMSNHAENIIQELNLIHISIDDKILVPGW